MRFDWKLRRSQENDNYSKNICGDCLNDLANTARFRKRCLKAERILQNAMKFTDVVGVSQSLTQNSHGLKEVIVEEIKLEDDYPIAETLNDIQNPQDECESTIEYVVAEDPNALGFHEFDYDNLISSNNSEFEEIETIYDQTEVLDQFDIQPENIESSEPIRTQPLQLNFICMECGAGFAMQKNLAKHLISHEKFICAVCLTVFDSNKDLRSHEPIHATQSDTIDSLIDHDECTNHQHFKHDPKKRHVCVYCNKMFASNSALLAHVRVHTQERPFPCTYCMKRFRTAGAQELHERRHSGVKPYRCDICSRGFAESSNLKVHRRIHTKEKPHVCTVCSRAFSRVFLLKIHQRTHTGERPFSCSDCGKSFTQQGDLCAHKRIHTGERPFKCNMCDKKFIKSSGLRQHMKQHGKQMQHVSVIGTLENSDNGFVDIDSK
ncbi:zinc finger protein 664-like isoform X2 [Topomyia yanbarensis]|uniref:zinc finger protein 664-like isoform X2 n=1 Tax=Topomyia yanbarensis TaxID=2498891 RepID=UPI00273C04A9|nr:zinc finger protein 664-like isoform X2 [Topomyia yanbarensis]